MVSYFPFGPVTIRVELLEVSPDGPYRLQIEQPARKVVEHFDTLLAALVRHAEVEAALSGCAAPWVEAEIERTQAS